MKEKEMKMDRISDMATAVFFAKQGQLFDEPVAETEEEAREFLEDCLAVVVPSIAQVRKYLDESGMDVMGLTDEEVADAAEVFALPDGTFLSVEG